MKRRCSAFGLASGQARRMALAVEERFTASVAGRRSGELPGRAASKPEPPQ